MLDVISGGRLNLGAARGGTAQEMALCGVDPEDTVAQVKEALSFIGHCWREDTIEWDCELLSIHPPPDRPPHTVVPRPVQLPHPPLFLACTNPETVRRAAEYGVGPDGAGLRRPRGDRHDARRMFDDARARRATRTRACRPATSTTSSWRCARRSSWTTATRRCASVRARVAVLRRGDHPLGRAQRRRTCARHRQGRQRRVHAGAPRSGARRDRTGRSAADGGVVALQPRSRDRRRRHRHRVRAAARGSRLSTT